MKTSFYFCVALLFFACQPRTKDNKTVEASVDSLASKLTIDPALSAEEQTAIMPLPDTMLYMDESVFGEHIPLKGENKEINNFFKVSGTQLIAKDSLLLMKNRSNEGFFAIYRLPEFELLSQFGKLGRGPGEFSFPAVGPSEDENRLAYIMATSNSELYSLDRNLELKKMNIPFPKKFKKFSDDKQIHGVSDREFYYVESTKNGKGLFHFKLENDSAKNRLLHSLSYMKNRKGWANYIGDFGANVAKKRAVYAYKYSKRVVFFDLENGTKRTLVFKNNDEPKKKGTNLLGPSNVTHYWGISAQKEYVYLCYSGRTPIQVGNENDKTGGYIFVEQYDWNGNPIRKFRLDRWGYLCVDNKEEKIILVSYVEEHPFFVYNIPKLGKEKEAL
ncbi:hypothetical protein FUAX_08940 [Fulvitalea axinellae]|uniref:TolB-like 6-blade propeller-like n=1 Tax=Fulvitalea axinellae TaxID=1182444 RepID=A0AAU9CNF5_9BACT|nr:hypothetical protein FUAX_08940 [Fulvitalea axinellae]